jgi:hypothetical protein
VFLDDVSAKFPEEEESPRVLAVSWAMSSVISSHYNINISKYDNIFSTLSPHKNSPLFQFLNFILDRFKKYEVFIFSETSSHYSPTHHTFTVVPISPTHLKLNCNCTFTIFFYLSMVRSDTTDKVSLHCTAV